MPHIRAQLGPSICMYCSLCTSQCMYYFLGCMQISEISHAPHSRAVRSQCLFVLFHMYVLFPMYGARVHTSTRPTFARNYVLFHMYVLFPMYGVRVRTSTRPRFARNYVLFHMYVLFPMYGARVRTSACPRFARNYVLFPMYALFCGYICSTMGWLRLVGSLKL